MDDPKLTAELVPDGQWESNLRALLTRAQWERCKTYAKERSGGVCAVCGGVGKRYPVDCHEQWAFEEDGVRHVQRLVGLVSLCPACHLVKHYGRAQARGLRREALDQLMTVNEWTKDDAQAHIQTSAMQWRERNCHIWELDLDWIRVVLSDWRAPAMTASRAWPQQAAPYRGRGGTVERRRARTAEWEDADPDNPFVLGSEESEEHELYMQMLADRD